MKILVAIANYGTTNDQYLQRLLTEYRSMSCDVDIVVLSNIHKNLGSDVEVRFGLPTKNPWSLPFGHKRIFADRLNHYDLFIYSEDDVLITEHNIRSFLEVSSVLAQDELAGFLRYELDGAGGMNICDVHSFFHWDPQSACARGEYTFGFFTNEHSASYVLTREQLKRAISSGGFLVPVHEGKHDLLCTAATDPYTQCGFRKLICVSHLRNFLVHHLPNKYVGSRFGVDEPELCRQIEALLKLGRNGDKPSTLFPTETKLTHCMYSKDYYEAAREDIEPPILGKARSVLSLGCGRGAMEARLASKGLRVVAVPVDPIISAGVQDRGVQLVQSNFGTALKELEGQYFDCLLLLNMLHLVEDPVQLLSSYKRLLSENAIVVATIPNLSGIPSIWQRIRCDGRLWKIPSYRDAGVHVTSRWIVRNWFERAGLSVEEMTGVVTPSYHRVSLWTLGLAGPLLASEYIAVSRNS